MTSHFHTKTCVSLKLDFQMQISLRFIINRLKLPAKQLKTFFISLNNSNYIKSKLHRFLKLFFTLEHSMTFKIDLKSNDWNFLWNRNFKFNYKICPNMEYMFHVLGALTATAIVYFFDHESHEMVATALSHFIAAEHVTRRKKTHLIFICRDSYLISASFITTRATQAASIVWMSRPQNFTVISTCVAPNWSCVEVSFGFIFWTKLNLHWFRRCYITIYFTLQTHSERAPEDEWLDILPHPVFSPDGDSFMLLAGIQETSTEHFTHIKHVTITQKRVSVISHGRYEVSFYPSVVVSFNLQCFWWLSVRFKENTAFLRVARN